jgi:hypothetical protein
VTEYRSLVVEKTRIEELIDVDESLSPDGETIKAYSVRIDAAVAHLRRHRPHVD